MGLAVWRGRADEFYRAAQTFHDETAADSRRRETWFVIVTVLALLVAAGSVALVAKGLLDKAYVPLVIELDTQSGRMAVVRELSGAPLPYDELRDRAFVGRYVLARETWDAASYPVDYRLVLLFSSDAVGERYREATASADADRARYGRRARVEVTIDSIAFWGPGLAYVRFSRARIPLADSVEAATGHYTAVVKFRYVDRPVLLGRHDWVDQWAGFMVESYRVDQDF